MTPRERARQLYDAGHSPKEIERLTGGEITAGNVRAWKSRHKWGPAPGGKESAAQQYGEQKRNNETRRHAKKSAVPGVAPGVAQQENATLQEAKPKRGRPPCGMYDIPEMTRRIERYIEENKDGIPILKECCLLNGWDYDYVMKLQQKNEELRQSIKKLLDWKEVRLERGALSGDYNKSMAIFILKQPAHGWSDRHGAQAGGSLEPGNPFAGLSTEELRKLVAEEDGDADDQ